MPRFVPDTTSAPPARIGWIVDAQNDFMLPAAPGGRLYVKSPTDPTDVGASAVDTNLRMVSALFDIHGIPAVCTLDWHAETDAEIDAVAPNFSTTYPPHCMGRVKDSSLAAGAQLIAGLRPIERHIMHTIAERPRDRVALAASAIVFLEDGDRVGITKDKFSVFEGNASVPEFFRLLSERATAAKVPATEFIVCGVATDVCVAAAVEGMLDRGFRVTVVTDAVHGLGLRPDAECFAAWAARGARLVTTAVLHEELTAELAAALSRDGDPVTASVSRLAEKARDAAAASAAASACFREPFRTREQQQRLEVQASRSPRRGMHAR